MIRSFTRNFQMEWNERIVWLVLLDISMIFTTYRSSGLGGEEDFTLILFPGPGFMTKEPFPSVINRMGLRPFYAFLRPHYLYLYMPRRWLYFRPPDQI